MLDNPAIQDLLVQLGVITSAYGDAIPSRRTITRRLDTFRDNIALHATQEQTLPLHMLPLNYTVTDDAWQSDHLDHPDHPASSAAVEILLSSS